MKILLFLATLLAAALAAIVFPEMKTTLLAIPLALALLTFAGCTSITSSLRKLPDGHFEGLEMVETDKFTSTTGKFAILDKDEDAIRARGVDLRHTNPWMTNVGFKSDVMVLDISRNASKRTNPPPLVKGEPFATPLPTATSTPPAPPAIH